MADYIPDPALVELVADAIAIDLGLEPWQLRPAARAVLSALATEGRLPAEIEWGWQGYSEQEPQRGMPLRDEAAAREVVAQHPGTELVRRQVGPWLPAPEETP